MDGRRRYRLDFADRLKGIREGRGMTQRQASDMSGIPYSSYQDYEHARALPDAERVMRLAWALAVDANALVGSMEIEEVG